MQMIDLLPGLADLIVRPTLVLMFATIAVFAMRRFSAASRHLVWSAALSAILVIPLLGPVAPDVGVRMSAEVVGLLDINPGRSAPAPGDAGAEGRSAPGSAAAGAQAEPTGGAELLLSLLWRSIWLAGCLGFLTVLGVRMTTLRLVERAAGTATEPALLETLESAKRSLGVERPVRLLLGEPAAMPMTWGFGTPRVLLPASATDWPREQTQVVLLHELAHVLRKDILLQRVAELARAVFWFNPLVWYAARRMLVEREHACDDAVLRSGVRGPEYAHQLLAMAHSLRSARGVAAALPMARRSQMTGRLMAILDEGRRRRASTAGGAGLVLMLGIATALAIASVRPAPLAATTGGDMPTGIDLSGGDLPQDIVANRPALSRPGASDCWPAGPDTNSNRNHDPGVIEAEWRTSRCEGGLRIEGRAVLRADSSGFAHLDPGTHVKLGEKEAGVWFKVELVAAPDGRIQRHGLRGDRPVRTDEVDAWIASTLRSVLRLTGVGLEVDGGDP